MNLRISIDLAILRSESAHRERNTIPVLRCCFPNARA